MHNVLQDRADILLRYTVMKDDEEARNSCLLGLIVVQFVMRDNSYSIDHNETSSNIHIRRYG
jgi:hypothetical protein